MRYPSKVLDLCTICQAHEAYRSWNVDRVAFLLLRGGVERPGPGFVANQMVIYNSS